MTLGNCTEAEAESEETGFAGLREPDDHTGGIAAECSSNGRSYCQLTGHALVIILVDLFKYRIVRVGLNLHLVVRSRFHHFV